MAGGAAESGRSVASRITAILMAFSTGGTHTLTELAARAGLPVSTTHRLVGELVARRVLERTESGGYRVGLPLRTIGGGTPHRPPLLDLGLSVLADLAEATQASVRLGVLDGRALAVVEAAPGRPAAGRFSPDPEPVYRSALGRALLAFSPAALVDEVLAAVRADGLPQSAVDQVRRALATTRQARVALRRQAHGTGAAIAVPVFGTGGTVLAALEAVVADAGTDVEPARSALLVAAGSLSRELATVRGPDQVTATGPDQGPGTEPDIAS